MNYIKPAILPFLTVALFAAALSFNFTIPLTAYEKLLDLLLSVSAILFAIIGAWVVLLYSNSLHKYLSDNSEEIRREADKAQTSASKQAAPFVEKARQSEIHLGRLSDALVYTSAILIFIIIAQSLLAFSGLAPELPSILSRILKSLVVASIPLLLSGVFYPILVVSKANYSILVDIQKTNAEFRARNKRGGQ